MGELETTHIKLIRPKREWLLHCNDHDDELATFIIGVNNGEIDIYGPQEDLITLRMSHIAEFHAALHEAISQADLDLAEQEAERVANNNYQA